MDGNYWEEQFNSYDLDLRKSKDSKEKEEKQVAEPPFVEDSVSMGQTDTELAVPESEEVLSDSPEIEKYRQKVDANKERYDQLLAKVGKREPHCVKKEEIEKAIAQMDECIAAINQLPDNPAQTPLAPTDRRKIKKRRIISKRLAEATDVFVSVKAVGCSFLELDKTEYFKHLEDHHLLMMSNMAARLFREKWEVILKNENAMQIRDAVDKILTAAERLAMSLVSVIDSFPGEDGATDLLKMIADQNEEDILHSVERTIMMVAKTQE